jgi:surface protein
VALFLGLAVPRQTTTSRLQGPWGPGAAVAMIVLLILPVTQALTAITNANIATAASAWVASPTTAAKTYGNIGDWNTATVTSMYDLFYNSATFNADISKWNTASVSNMASTFEWAAAFNANLAGKERALEVRFGPERILWIYSILLSAIIGVTFAVLLVSAEAHSTRVRFMATSSFEARFHLHVAGNCSCR